MQIFLLSLVCIALQYSRKHVRNKIDDYVFFYKANYSKPTMVIQKWVVKFTLWSFLFVSIIGWEFYFALTAFNMILSLFINIEPWTKIYKNNEIMYTVNLIVRGIATLFVAYPTLPSMWKRLGAMSLLVVIINFAFDAIAIIIFPDILAESGIDKNLMFIVFTDLIRDLIAYTFLAIAIGNIAIFFKDEMEY